MKGATSRGGLPVPKTEGARTGDALRTKKETTQNKTMMGDLIAMNIFVLLLAAAALAMLGIFVHRLHAGTVDKSAYIVSACLASAAVLYLAIREFPARCHSHATTPIASAAALFAAVLVLFVPAVVHFDVPKDDAGKDLRRTVWFMTGFLAVSLVAVGVCLMLV